MPIPNPVRLFHITAIANLPAICAQGSLLSKNAVARSNIAYENIAYQGAQGARAQRPVPNPPGGVVHDYVPFYFAPRSPMLRAIEGGRVDGCAWRQADIVHFETTIERLTANESRFVFFDRNATLQFSTAFTNLQHLDKIAWDLLTESPVLDGFCKYWKSVVSNPRYAERMERRQAEFLIRDRVPLQSFSRIGVIDAQRRDEVLAILLAAGVNLPVEIKTDWYFLGQ
jgi:ssDNA thymidine ADP-ribosyltransferase, DarT